MLFLRHTYRINQFSKKVLIVLIAIITITSIKVQSASAINAWSLGLTANSISETLSSFEAPVFILPKEEIKKPVAQVAEVKKIDPAYKVKYTRNYTVTAYNSVPWQTDNTPCISADGSNICQLKAQGHESCAAALPFGTKINIPGFGVCTVHDRLAPRFAHRIDLYFGDADKIKAARQWGKRRLKVSILDS